MGPIMKNPVALGVIVIALLFTLLNTLIIVPETRQGVVVRFGEPVRIINRYQNDVPFGQTGAGLLWKIPFLEQVVWIDKRIRDVEMEQQQVLSTDQLRLQVDAFARFRITNPLRMYIAAGSEERSTAPIRGCGPPVIRKRGPFAHKVPSRHRSSVPKPMPAPPAPMPRALARIRTSMISTAP